MLAVCSELLLCSQRDHLCLRHRQPATLRYRSSDGMVKVVVTDGDDADNYAIDSAAVAVAGDDDGDDDDDADDDAADDDERSDGSTASMHVLM